VEPWRASGGFSGLLDLKHRASSPRTSHRLAPPRAPSYLPPSTTSL